MPRRLNRRVFRMRTASMAVILLLVTGALRTPGFQRTRRQRSLRCRAAGARGDGKTLDTAAIQHALDECGNAGGGIVRFSAGVYLSKPIFLRSKTTLELGEGATLKATDEEADFADPAKPTGAWRAFIGFAQWPATCGTSPLSGRGRLTVRARAGGVRPERRNGPIRSTRATHRPTDSGFDCAERVSQCAGDRISR